MARSAGRKTWRPCCALPKQSAARHRRCLSSAGRCCTSSAASASEQQGGQGVPQARAGRGHALPLGGAQREVGCQVGVQGVGGGAALAQGIQQLGRSQARDRQQQAGGIKTSLVVVVVSIDMDQRLLKGAVPA